MTSERIYQGEDQGWYFSIRGNQAMGPFLTYPDAESALEAHVESCQHRISGSLRWPRSWHPLRTLRRSAARHS